MPVVVVLVTSSGGGVGDASGGDGLNFNRVSLGFAYVSCYTGPRASGPITVRARRSPTPDRGLRAFIPTVRSE